ncbi:MAG: hypothetical protein HYS27_24325 [Deltaproteobacteria bacterium]|nr:hypothetical protein [Deltaproteobacteria bacterium]
MSTIEMAVLGGIAKASTTAYDTFGVWLNEFPEYYVTSKVADRVARAVNDRGWVHLEQQRSRVLKAAKAERRGRRSPSTPSGAKFDLIVYYANDKPRVVVEIKSPVFTWNSQINRDVVRLCDTVARSRDASSIQCGILGVYTDASHPRRKDADAATRVERLLNEWEDRVRKCTEKKGLNAVFSRTVGSRRYSKRARNEAWAAWIAGITVV